MRRVFLVNALIFAVLAAAVALAYYGYSYTSEVSSNERELALLQELADDRVVTIESQIESTDRKVLSGAQIEPVSLVVRESTCPPPPSERPSRP